MNTRRRLNALLMAFAPWLAACAADAVIAPPESGPMQLRVTSARVAGTLQREEFRITATLVNDTDSTFLRRWLRAVRQSRSKPRRRRVGYAWMTSWKWMIAYGVSRPSVSGRAARIHSAQRSREPPAADDSLAMSRSDCACSMRDGVRSNRRQPSRSDADTHGLDHCRPPVAGDTVAPS